jgi:hypothetical protein
MRQDLMKKCTVCLIIALVLLTLGSNLLSGALGQTENIKIVSYSYYVDNLGYLDVVGEVQNVGPNTVDPVALTGSVFASGDVHLSDSACRVWVSYLVPGQKAPFYMEFQPPSNLGYSSYWNPSDISKITFNVAMANATSSYQYPDLKITSSSSTIGTSGDYKGAYLVNGIIQNTGSQTATNLTVVGTFYNASGTVVAVGYTNYLTPSTLEPSVTLSFQIAAFDLNQSLVQESMKISSYALLVQTQEPILQGTAPIVTPYQTNQSPSSTGTTSSPTSGTVNSNSSPDIVIIVAVVAVIVILAIFGATVALRKSRPRLTAKEAKKARKKRMVQIWSMAFS